MRSMTGYGKHVAEENGIGVECEIKSWNHKGFDVALRIPDNYGHLELTLRDRISRRAGRGKVSCQVRLRGLTSGRNIRLNESLVSSVIEPFRAVAARHDVTAAISLGDLLAIPGIIEIEERPDDAVEKLLIASVDSALTAWEESRLREGERLREALLKEAGALKKAIAAIEERRRDAVNAQMERLRERVREIAGEIAMDEKRLEMEIALLGEKADIKEEAVRIAAHLETLDRLLDAGTAAIGSELTFLLQELLRESNTIGSKTQDLAITRSVIAAKTAIDRIKEISANVV